MPTITHTTDFGVPGDFLFRWHKHPGALQRMLPPYQPIRVIARDGGIDNGRLVFALSPVPGISLRWEAQHIDYEEGRQFRDVQVSGPFKSWTHTHRFEEGRLTDEVDYALGFPAILGSWRVRRELAEMFQWRHERLRRDLARHRPYLDRPRMRVAITGASGLVGTALTAFLATAGHEVIALTRRKPTEEGQVYWNPATGEIDAAGLEGVDAVVNLAGASIAQRWTPEAMRVIKESRVAGTRLLSEALAGLERPPAVLVSASAVGIYGDRGDSVLTEADVDDRPGFLAEVGREWEAAAEPARQAGIRVCHPRIGIVLAGNGAILQKLRPLFLIGGGGPVGDGRQWVPWIDLDDLLGILHHLIMESDCSGAYNAVHPSPVDNRTFSRALGRALSRPALIPAPTFAVRMVMGASARLALDSARVVPQRLEEAGFSWHCADVEDSMRWQLGSWHPR